MARLCLFLNKPVDPDEIRSDIEQRDKRDRERAVAPLTIPSGAIVLDNSHLTLEESADFFLRHIQR